MSSSKKKDTRLDEKKRMNGDDDNDDKPATKKNDVIKNEADPSNTAASRRPSSKKAKKRASKKKVKNDYPPTNTRNNEEEREGDDNKNPEVSRLTSVTTVMTKPELLVSGEDEDLTAKMTSPTPHPSQDEECTVMSGPELLFGLGDEEKEDKVNIPMRKERTTLAPDDRRSDNNSSIPLGTTDAVASLSQQDEKEKSSNNNNSNNKKPSSKRKITTSSPSKTKKDHPSSTTLGGSVAALPLQEETTKSSNNSGLAVASPSSPHSTFDNDRKPSANLSPIIRMALAPATGRKSESSIPATPGAVASLPQDEKIKSSSSGLTLHDQKPSSKHGIALAPGRSDSSVTRPGAVASLPQDEKLKSSRSGLTLAAGIEPTISEASVSTSEENRSISSGVPGAHPISSLSPPFGLNNHPPPASPARVAHNPSQDNNNVVEPTIDEEQPILAAKLVEETEVAEAVPLQSRTGKKVFRIAVLLLLATLLAIGLGFGLTRGADKNKTPATEPPLIIDPRPTLEAILDRGVVRCGVEDELLGFSMMDEDGIERIGFQIDMCKAMAAAIFGTEYSSETAQNLYEPVPVSRTQQWSALVERSIDVATRTTTYTMERDVYQRNAGTGFTFSVPFMYDGLGFAGIPPYVTCADELQVTGEFCKDLKICTLGNSTHWDQLSSLLPLSRLVKSNATHSSMDSFLYGSCNVIAGESKEISEVIARDAGYAGNYELGTAQYTKEPLAFVTRDVDAPWSRFVDLILQALMEAEAQGVTQETASLFSTTIDPGAIFGDGDRYQDMFVHAIRAVGNYGEIYNRHLEWIIPRKLVNTVHHPGQESSGVRYALPFGSLQGEGPGPVPGGMLEQLERQGFLRCGIRSDSNMEDSLDAQYCRAVSASLFAGVVDTIEYIPIVSSAEEGPFAGSEQLQSGDFDIFAGMSARIATMANFSLSMPYYFFEVETDTDGGDDGRVVRDAVVLASRSEDPQFSDFIYWVISSLVYAEEKGITRQEPNEMPTVNLFGPTYARMFRDAILVVGNAGEMLARARAAPNSSFFLDGRAFNGTSDGSVINALNIGKPLGPQFFPLV